MDIERRRALRRLHLVLDGLVLVAALPTAWLLHTLLRGVLPFVRSPPSVDQLAVLPLLFPPLFLLLLFVFGMHRATDEGWGKRALLKGLLKVHLVAFLGLTVLVFATQAILNRSLSALYLGCTFALLYAERALIGRWYRYQHASGQGRTRLLLVGGDGPELRRFLARAAASPLPPLLVGRLAPEGEGEVDVPEARRLGPPDALEEVLHTEAVDQVLFFPPLHRPADATALLSVCEMVGVQASFALETPRLSVAAPRVSRQYDAAFVTFEVAPKRPEALAIKHFLDVLAAAVIVLLVSPVLLFAALGILLTMGRPIFFSQERAGLHGRTFRMLKFRTMGRDAERMRDQLLALNEAGGPVFKSARDPRITPFGHLLRRASIDELPQLLHVLSGKMSLVGPRPLPVKEQSAIRGWHRRRLSMKPGLTGLWQVSGRSDIDFEGWMKLDLQYVDSWSLGLDLRILLRTVPAVLLGRGAR
jgi:exopolysaccharide biosynthesis polyprenyl glycosylphosphotransferase